MAPVLCLHTVSIESSGSLSSGFGATASLQEYPPMTTTSPSRAVLQRLRSRVTRMRRPRRRRLRHQLPLWRTCYHQKKTSHSSQENQARRMHPHSTDDAFRLPAFIHSCIATLCSNIRRPGFGLTSQAFAFAFTWAIIRLPAFQFYRLLCSILVDKLLLVYTHLALILSSVFARTCRLCIVIPQHGHPLPTVWNLSTKARSWINSL
jgi:hypothetical protein